MTLGQPRVSIEQLVESIVREVIAELGKRGVEIGGPGAPAQSRPAQHASQGTSLEIDMSAYRTPVLTENQLTRIDGKIGTIVVPCNTVVTPGAWGIIRSKKLTLVRKTQSNR